MLCNLFVKIFVLIVINCRRHNFGPTLIIVKTLVVNLYCQLQAHINFVLFCFDGYFVLSELKYICIFMFLSLFYFGKIYCIFFMNFTFFLHLCNQWKISVTHKLLNIFYLVCICSFFMFKMSQWNHFTGFLYDICYSHLLPPFYQNKVL